MSTHEQDHQDGTVTVGSTGHPGAGELAGQVALVTGGVSGIGAATSRLLLARGATVVAVDLAEDLVATFVAETTGSAAHPRLQTRRLDVTDRADVEACVAAVTDEHGRLDVVVNSAGITGPSMPMWEVDPDFWHRIYDVHVHGTFYVLRAVLPHMVGQGYGRVVNVASVAGKEGNANSAAYSSAKAAVLGMTKSLGKELATTGVLVNAVTPGQFATPMQRDVTPSHHEVLLAKIPMGRMGRPEEAAEMIGFLASPRTSFSTGAVFDLSGGRTTY